jgi:hypothetical protein
LIQLTCGLPWGPEYLFQVTRPCLCLAIRATAIHVMVRSYISPQVHLQFGSKSESHDSWYRHWQPKCSTEQIIVLQIVYVQPEYSGCTNASGLIVVVLTAGLIHWHTLVPVYACSVAAASLRVAELSTGSLRHWQIPARGNVGTT